MSTVASFCRNCGKALSDEEKAVPGAVYCGSCAPAMAPPPLASPPPPPLPPGSGVWSSGAAATGTAAANATISPGLAFLLGLLPGVGAIYNGQYAKGLVHVFILGLLISIAESGHGGGPLIGFMIAGWAMYMPFEAYHTALKRSHGEPVDEFSSLYSPPGGGSGFPAAPVALIAIGVLMLLSNLEILRFSQIAKFWPVLLILAGVNLLRQQLRASGQERTGNQEASNDLLR